MKNIQSIVESRLARMQEQRNTLVQDWSLFLNTVNEHYKNENGRELTDMDKSNIAVCLENALIQATAESRNPLLETTDSSAIKFLGVEELCIA